jgi:hypothetical protein
VSYKLIVISRNMFVAWAEDPLGTWILRAIDLTGVLAEVSVSSSLINVDQVLVKACRPSA